MLNHNEKKVLFSVLIGEIFLFVSYMVWKFCLNNNVKSTFVQVGIILLIFTISIVSFNKKISNKYYKIGYKFSFFRQVKRHIIVYIIFTYIFIFISANIKFSKINTNFIPDGVINIWLVYIFCYFHIQNCKGFIRACRKKYKNYV